MITSYTTIFQKPNPNQTVHIVILDNGRSRILKHDDFRNSLKCIRCGACLNTCPVYRRSGGHSYHATIPGPIGSILNPHRNKTEFGDLPFASTLCGSCSNVCPVKIDIHNQLFLWRQELKDIKKMPKSIFSFLRNFMSDPKKFMVLHKIARFTTKFTPHFIEKKIKRNLPEIPPKTFRQIYLEQYHDKIK